eukprot:gnl/TRDRNA2_/TRDRNA2_55207_c0_seq1.p1 gnl/TRDRNA2_/TRDRNA2_55207_c0~~gnl/TRDRNA2_/TRDRNA2_55207_c0_seq1.p1  ORF type:complete len:502 (-),score=126.05 gnl/TRDRNA2_/TRDRNA2_55207_c0_seq1:33-1472(-)
MPFGRPDVVQNAAKPKGVFVHAVNLADTVTSQSLRETLQTWGVNGIAEVNVEWGRLGLVGKIKFNSVTQAELCVQANGVVLEGRPLMMQMAPQVVLPKGKGGGKDEKKPPAKKVEEEKKEKEPCVKVSNLNLTKDSTPEELVTHLRSYGVLGIEDVNLASEGDHAYIQFETLGNVTSAITKANDTKFKGKNIIIEPSPDGMHWPEDWGDDWWDWWSGWGKNGASGKGGKASGGADKEEDFESLSKSFGMSKDGSSKANGKGEAATSSGKGEAAADQRSGGKKDDGPQLPWPWGSGDAGKGSDAGKGDAGKGDGGKGGSEWGDDWGSGKGGGWESGSSSSAAKGGGKEGSWDIFDVGYGSGSKGDWWSGGGKGGGKGGYGSWDGKGGYGDRQSWVDVGMKMMNDWWGGSGDGGWGGGSEPSGDKGGSGKGGSWESGGSGKGGDWESGGGWEGKGGYGGGWEGKGDWKGGGSSEWNRWGPY